MSRIETTLDRSHRAYHQRAGTRIYITEWGIQSKNPSPFVKFTRPRTPRTATLQFEARGSAPPGSSTAASLR